MRKRTLFSTLMLPTLLALLMLPPLSCMIFQRTATQRAYSEVTDKLQTLNQSILPLIDETFRSSSQREGQEDVLGFLRKVSQAVRKVNGSVIILEARLRVIYPYDETERAAVADFAELCIAHLPDESEQVIELVDAAGERYLVQYDRLPTESRRIRYVITYGSVSQMDAWVADATLQVLLISAGVVLLVFLVLFFAIRGVSKPLKQLSDGVTTIGEGSFVQLEQPFALQELEAVRLATNRMSRRLQKAEQTQRDFLQNVSHELRNPLMSIGGYAQGIERGIFPAPETAAHTILEESTRLTELVSELLTLSRLENDTQTLVMEKLPVMETIQDCLDRANGMALQKQIRLMLEPSASDAAAWASEELLSQILDNLLSNAIRYARTTVTVTMDEAPGAVIIRVLDDGEGIAQADLPHVFERCYKGKGGHFGIGLAIAASAAEKMACRLSADNRIEGGAVFTLEMGA